MWLLEEMDFEILREVLDLGLLNGLPARILAVKFLPVQEFSEM
jgi:hypothetical protein